MGKYLFSVDFNEMPERNIVLLSNRDVALDHNGNSVSLKEGLQAIVYEDGGVVENSHEYLFAYGEVVMNSRSDWSGHVKWCFKIDSNGIRYTSDLSSIVLTDL